MAQQTQFNHNIRIQIAHLFHDKNIASMMKWQGEDQDLTFKEKVLLNDSILLSQINTKDEKVFVDNPYENQNPSSID